jgi:hypothetical protein
VSPPSATYRLRKFARRNKLALTIAGTFAAALLLWVAVLSVSTVLISRSYTAERKARQQAEANFQRTRAAVDEFFTTVSQSTLFDVPGLQPRRKELLESAVRYYRNLAAEAGEDLSVRAGLAAAHFRLAEVYFEVDQANDSIREVDAGLDLVDQLLQEHPADADLLRRIGGFWKGTRRMSWTARSPDDQAGAERTLIGSCKSGKDWPQKTPGCRPSRVIWLRLMAVLAMAQHRLGRGEQALAALDKAEAIMAKKMADPGAGRPFGRDWDDWLRSRILLDEAGKLLKKDSPAKNHESGKKPH